MNKIRKKRRLNCSDQNIIENERSSESATPIHFGDVEGSTWDDCKIISNIFLKTILTGCHIVHKFSEESNKKKNIYPSLRSNLLDSSVTSAFHNYWMGGTPMKNENFEIITNPFNVAIIKDLISSNNLLDELRQELYELEFNSRNMDLYEFFQSKDLQHSTSSKIKTICDFMKTDVMTWVATITGLNLTHISITCSLYTSTDYLLVHDDKREDRMVAFILYLADKDEWTEADGGTLQLISKDENGHPSDILRNIIPENNQLAFFRVTNDSYHQVAEVTNLGKYRLSINGWFHSKDSPEFESPVYHPPTDGLYSNSYKAPKIVDINLNLWIGEDYLEQKTIRDIQKHIEDNSEISLQNFFKEEAFREILESLQESENMQWKRMGPINRFNYEVADLTTLPHTIERLFDLFQSREMFRLLQKYTDLDLDTENSSVKFELQKWTPGNYALLTEYDWEKKNELDLIIYFGCQNRSDVIGARTHYVTIEDEIQNALITIEPQENNLNIVYRDSARFTSYFSRQSKCQCFYTFICSYSE